MSFFLVDTKVRIPLVCSTDPAVTLLFVPQTEEQKAKELPPVRQERRPLRWLRAVPHGNAPAQIESAGADAITVIVRPIASSEQMACSGGIGHLNQGALCRAHYQATNYCVVAATGPGIDARKPEEIAAFLDSLPLNQREALGAPVFNECAGLNDPFVFAV